MNYKFYITKIEGVHRLNLTPMEIIIQGIDQLAVEQAKEAIEHLRLFAGTKIIHQTKDIEIKDNGRKE